jgi:hypothetical protein
MRLTNAKVKEAKNTTDKPMWLYDDELTGLALSISPKQRKVWYVYTWSKNRPVREKMGTFPALNASEARDQAKEILGALTQSRDFQRKAKARKLTVGNLWDEWFTHRSKPRKRTWKRDQTEYESYVKPVLHSILIAGVERSHVERMLTNISGTHSIGAANKTRSLLSAMFDFRESTPLRNAPTSSGFK